MKKKYDLSTAKQAFGATAESQNQLIFLTVTRRKPIRLEIIAKIWFKNITVIMVRSSYLFHC